MIILPLSVLESLTRADKYIEMGYINHFTRVFAVFILLINSIPNISACEWNFFFYN